MMKIRRIFAALIVVTLVVAMASTAMAYKEKAIAPKLVKFIGSAWGYDHVTNDHGKGKSDVALRKGSVGIAVAEKGNWYKIEIPGRGYDTNEDGPYEYLWFCKDHLKDTKASGWRLVFSSGGSGRSLPVYDEPYKANYKKVQVLKGRRTNVRKTSSLKGKSLGVVRDGQKLKYLGVRGYDTLQNMFYKVKYDGKVAWVSSEYTKLVKK